jgi:hypothetical protein
MIQVTKIGTPLVLRSDAPAGAPSVMFEDDGDTGYFYAIEPRGEAMELLDALHVYNAEADLRGVDCRLELLWSADGRKAGLRLNGALWAVFDFDAEQGRCRSNYPPPAGRWQAPERPAWHDSLLDSL